MKKIVDKELPIIIKNKLASYDLVCETWHHKRGYLLYDENERNIGLVFVSNRKGASRHAEIAFFKKHRTELGCYRKIKLNKQDLAFDRLEKILKADGYYKCVTDERKRNPY
ncbi:MAG: hypothetical protein LBP26_02525 [Clostridiales bacterium]|nr:hypothetical protein [Clostridiales bacterium]